MAQDIADYALIGDCETAALVGRNGSIDWLCWPRFDSEACFAALLGKAENGRWSLAPAGEVRRAERHYRDDTLVLETEFETDDGAVTVTDFMPIRGIASDVVRIVVGNRGAVPMRMELAIRFDYGRLVPWVTRVDDGCLRAVAGPHSVVLRTPAPFRGEDCETVADFTVRAGEQIPFVLTYQASHLPVPHPVDADKALDETMHYWTDWARRFRPHSKETAGDGHFAEAALRSLITIKAMTYRPTGGIVAAPTTSLPEQEGGSRNWDYRFCWLRDATFVVESLLKAGFHKEAEAWRNWLLRAIAGMPSQIQPMYGIAGEHRLQEWKVPWLAGYGGAQPVRIGNAAYQQFQLDSFGEIMDALHVARHSDLHATEAGWNLQLALVKHLKEVWQKPDEGIWEVRGGAQHFTHSKVMCWVAIDRAVKAVEQFGLAGPVEEWRRLRDRIHAEICERAFDEKRNSFVQSYGSSHLDAATLQIPIVGFLPPDDPRVRGTVEAIERDLMCDGFVLRYDTEGTKDGLPPGEGAFLACSFWLADAYALMGRRDDARDLFERLLSLRNDVGLLSEEYDPKRKRLIGNFPQALSHLALVNTAHTLAGVRKPAGRKSS